MNDQSCCGSEQTGQKGTAPMSARVLSQKATEEILGSDLAFLIAVDKSGKPVRYLPFGTDLSAQSLSISQDDSNSVLDISVRIPGQSNEITAAVGGGTETSLICWCKHNGIIFPC